MIEEILNKIYTSNLLSSEELHELTEWVCNKDEDIKVENENLKKILDDIEAFIKSCNEEKMSIEQRLILDTIILIKNGEVKYLGETTDE